MYEKFEEIKQKTELKSTILYKILTFKMEWAINQPSSLSDNFTAVIVSIWKGTYCERAFKQLNYLDEATKIFFAKSHVDHIQLYKDKLYKLCTEPGMLTKLDLLRKNLSLKEYLEIDIESDNQRERLRKHFIKALFGESKIAIIRNRNAVQIISFIRWINKDKREQAKMLLPITLLNPGTLVCFNATRRAESNHTDNFDSIILNKDTGRRTLPSRYFGVYPG
uniref:Uncharacterized protein n=1 Tax=Meloidogyne hapla TaxID=6305 RepID=A0A1I8BSA7_MELHA